MKKIKEGLFRRVGALEPRDSWFGFYLLAFISGVLVCNAVFQTTKLLTTLLLRYFKA